jgi:Matrixin
MTTSVETNAAGQALGWNQPPAITWSFATQEFPDDGIRNAPPFDAYAVSASAQMTYRPFVEVAMDVWSAVADVTFQEVPDSPNADIRIGFGNLLPGSIGNIWYEYSGDTFLPGTVVQIESPQHTPLKNTDLGPAYTGYETLLLQDLMAQIGHAIGLGFSTDDPTSIAAPLLGADNLLPDNADIMAIQSIYGPPFIPVQNAPDVNPQDIPAGFIPPGVTTAPKPPSAPPPRLTTSNPLLDIKSGALFGTSQIDDALHAGRDFLNTQVLGSLFDFKSGEVEVPTSDHGHYGAAKGNSFVLLHDGSNFQLFNSYDPVLTFIVSNNNNASYWHDGEQTIYDFGQGNTLRFSDLGAAPSDVFGFDHDSTGNVVIYNADLPITPDGQGGTLVGNIDFHNAMLDSSRVSFVTQDLHLDTHPSLVAL